MSALPADVSPELSNEHEPPAAADGPTENYLSAELDGVIQGWLRAAIPETGRSYRPRMRTPNQ
jgi:hypothetical protein